MIRFIVICSTFFLLSACSTRTLDVQIESITPTLSMSTTPSFDPNFVPQFINTDYIELDNISQISLFRSSEGHDYSDSYESCRSMKHYFKPYEYLDWSEVKIYSPVDGEIFKLKEEWAGTKIEIKPTSYPDFTIVIFHVKAKSELHEGLSVSAGMELGTHISIQTNSDIAVGRNAPNGLQWVSFFDVMTDELFKEYQIRGVQSRSELIISREERDADPLTCDGETFTSRGNHDNYYLLNTAP